MEWINYIGSIATGISLGGIVQYSVGRSLKKWEKVQNIPDTNLHWCSMVQSNKYGATMIIAALPKNHDIQYTSPMTWQINKPLEEEHMNIVSRHEHAIASWWKKQRLDIIPLSAGVRMDIIGHYLGKYPAIVLRAKDAHLLHGLEWQWIEWLSQCTDLPATPQDDKAVELDTRDIISTLRIPVFSGTLLAFVINMLLTREWVFLSHTQDIWRFAISFMAMAFGWSAYAMLKWTASPYLKQMLLHSIVSITFPFAMLTYLTLKHYEMDTAVMICEGQYSASSIHRGKTKTATIDFSECKEMPENEHVVRTNVPTSVHDYIQSYQKASTQIYRTSSGRTLIKFLLDN